MIEIRLGSGWVVKIIFGGYLSAFLSVASIYDYNIILTFTFFCSI